MKKFQNESTAVDFLGTTFVAFPRSVFDLLFHQDKKMQAAGRVYTALVSRVFYTKGCLKVKNSIVSCNPGEYIATHQEMADYCGMKYRLYYYALRRLIDKGIVSTNTLLGVTRFTLPGYTNFYKQMKATGRPSGPVAAGSLEEAERRMGGRSMQFDKQRKGEQA